MPATSQTKRREGWVSKLGQSEVVVVCVWGGGGGGEAGFGEEEVRGGGVWGVGG